MAIRKIPFTSGDFYHLYNRGNSRQVIFHDKQDYDRFVFLLFAMNTKQNIISRLIFKDMYGFNRGNTLVSIGAYCLMPNHFHLLITEKSDGGISKFMQKLSTAYSMYYNTKYHRTGGLFEGKFKSQHLDKDQYLKYIFSYIHLNPLKLFIKNWKTDGIKNKKDVSSFLKNYSYSSFSDYLGEEREEYATLGREDFPDYFPSTKDFFDEIMDWIKFPDHLSTR